MKKIKHAAKSRGDHLMTHLRRDLGKTLPDKASSETEVHDDAYRPDNYDLWDNANTHAYKSVGFH